MTEEHNQFLLDLRDSGATNMWGAGPYLEQEFNLTRREASDILIEWIKSFNKK